jgi:hypothetical protein
MATTLTRFQWYVETMFLVKLEAEQNIVFQNYVQVVEITENRIRTKVQNHIHYVSIGARPCPFNT